MKALTTLRGKAQSYMAQLNLALFLLCASIGTALATTPVDDVKAAIESGKADAIAIAVAVVITLWAIWSVYLMRRKG